MDKATMMAMAARYASAADEAGHWVAHNADRVQKCGKSTDEVLASLRRQARELRRLERAAGRRMCVGVFGPSQAGKSYLLGALARGAGNSLGCRFGNETHDFLKELNPPGGKESTGLVTRFTMHAPAGMPADCPVHVRLFSETELVKILANSFFLDSDPKSPPSPNMKNDMRAAVEALKGRATSHAPHITLDVMEDLHEYVRNSFGGRSRASALEDVYWDDAIEMAPRMSLEDRASLFSIIWNGIPEFTQLFLALASDLARLGNPEEAFCSMDSLVPRKASIIDVDTLQKTDFSECGASPMVQMRSPSGLLASISRKNATAIVAELTLVMTHKPADYFDHTDLLDFPGYKARLECSDVAVYLHSNEKDATVEQFFRRGKVDYLFQRYSAERELTSLLLCVASTDIVPGLAKAVQDWVIATHGRTPEERLSTRNALFYVLTKSDRHFENVSGASPEERWDSALVGNFLSHFTGSYSQESRWVEEWTPGRPFNNLFLLRNVSFHWTSILDFDGDKETDIRASQKEYVYAMRDAFLVTASVKKHFASPATAMEEFLKLNDGGIEHIKRSLEPLCDPELKLSQVGAALERARQTLESTLAPFYHSGDSAEELKKKKRLFKKLNDLFKDPAALVNARFPELLSSFRMAPEVLAPLYEDAQQQFRNYRVEAASAPVQSGSSSASSGSGLFSDFFFDDDDDDEPVAQQPAAPAMPAAAAEPKDQHSFYAAQIMESWSSCMHGVAETDECTRYYCFPKQLFIAMLDEIDAAVVRLELQKKLERKFREIARPVTIDTIKMAHMQACYAACVLGDFLSWLGHKPSEMSTEERRITVWSGETTVFADLPEVKGYPELGEEFGTCHRAWMKDWFYAFYAMLIDNASFTDGTKINIEENAKLGQILQKIRQ